MDRSILDILHPEYKPLAENIGNEGDVRRLFYRYLSGTVMVSLTSLHVIERSETGPAGPTSAAVTVDARFTVGNEVVAAVEFKKPYSISEAQ